MPSFDQYPESELIKMIYLGDSGCLTGNTIVSMRRGGKPRKLSIRRLYNRFKGNHGNKTQVPTYLLADMGGYAGQLLMLDVVKTGKKQVFKLVAGGSVIKASADHQFKTEFGWLTLSELKVGMSVSMWRSSRSKLFRKREIYKISGEQRRVTIESIPNHPFGWSHVIAGKDYKRAPKARLVIEANMNGLSLEEFIFILRNDSERSVSLKYIDQPNVAFHHIDGNWLNDSIENLEVIDNHKHTLKHHAEKVRASKELFNAVIESISPVGEEETFDICMQGPEHNFIANGFVVHNSGKTGSLCSLAAAGYNVRVLDLDKGALIIKDFVTNRELSPYLKPKAGLWVGDEGVKSRINYVEVSETFTNIGGRPVPKGDSWQKIMAQLTEWKDGTTNLGKLETWGPSDVLVVDSFSRFCDARMYLELVMNARASSGRQMQDYWKVQDDIERSLEMLVSPSVKCHVIVVCHIDYVEKDDKTVRGMPQSMGKALGPKIGQHFNHAIMAKTVGQGTTAQYKIFTKTQGTVDLKNAAPLRVKPEYPLETGLLEYFHAVLGKEQVEKQTGRKVAL